MRLVELLLVNDAGHWPCLAICALELQITDFNTLLELTRLQGKSMTVSSLIMRILREYEIQNELGFIAEYYTSWLGTAPHVLDKLLK